MKAMKTEFNIGCKVWIMSYDKPKRVKIDRIVIDSGGITYTLSTLVNYYTRKESQIGETKQDLFKKIFEL